MFWVFAAVAIAYYALGYWLTEVAFRYLRPDVPTRNLVHIHDAEKFAPEGQVARRRAVLFWWGGLPIVVATLVLSMF